MAYCSSPRLWVVLLLSLPSGLPNLGSHFVPPAHVILSSPY
jgi:hypothetical protein